MKHYVLSSQNIGAVVVTKSNPESKKNQLTAAIEKLDEAMDASAKQKNICNVKAKLNEKFPAKSKTPWPTHFAWIKHWEKSGDNSIAPRTKHYENISMQNFNDVYVDIVNKEVFYDFSTNESILGCFYDCRSK